MAAIAWRIATVLRPSSGLAAGPLAAVFVFAGPACWFVGVLAAACVRAGLRRSVARRYRSFLAGSIPPPVGSPPPSLARSPVGTRYPAAFVATLPRLLRGGVPSSLPVPPPPVSRPDEPIYLPVPKPFGEMNEREVDAWVEAAAAAMLGSLTNQGEIAEE
jgi:hypothetical protein